MNPFLKNICLYVCSTWTQAYYDLFQCWVWYHVGFILLSCIYVDVCLWNVNQYYREKNGFRKLFHSITWLRVWFNSERMKVNSEIWKHLVCFCFSQCPLTFEHFWSKWASWLKYFLHYWLQKTWLLKWIKGPVSGNLSRVNLSMTSKTAEIYRKAFFILLFHHFELN